MFANVPQQDNTYWNGREVANGDGLAPFNSTGHPFVTFALLDSCHSGSTLEFEALMYPFLDGYDLMYCKDQAVVGWPGCTFILQSRHTTWWFFHKLRIGWTVWEALMNFLDENWFNNNPVYIHMAYNLVDDLTECTLMGDVWTRIKRVYTGNDSVAPGVWFRPL